MMTQNGRIIYSAWKYLYAIDAKTGEIETSFGERENEDLRKGLGEAHFAEARCRCQYSQELLLKIF